MAGLRTLALAGILLASFLYSRIGLLSTFYYNHPSRLQKVNRPGNIEINFSDDVRNCEDVLVNEEEAWMLLSCDPGRDEWNTVMGTFVNHTAPPETGLYIWKYTEAGAKPSQLKLLPFENGHPDFHPLGIGYHAPTKTIFVANHASRNSRIELYRLDVAQGEATLFAAVENPRLAAPNSIAAVSDTEFYVTNDHFFLARNIIALAKLETYLALPGANVVHVKIQSNGSTVTRSLARLPFANGIAFLNETTLAVASSVSAAVFLYNIEQKEAGPALTVASKIPVTFIPDNVSVDSKGKLLIAGHPHAPSLEKASKNNRFCQHAGAENDERCKFPKLSWVAEWSEEEGLSDIYVGSDFGTSSTAVRDASRGLGFISGLYERGILSWKE
ncbi:hypothetical protein M409DRAFT_28731 [Zasmidium cellare ATCC 36951]|uniref:Paraoxonase n=1 Tax=Zasmidium cellare ATCC 36951 TaxID=1080233 RepID=A0A6A6C1F4_ZASCE|nr:uncharacterized protein M409DRAFT_28731 [Zasmidium cellare ATCC 36951]KAF2160851.1 hypothetical protein M409DRAFT_28731 [Zasmidium cellare ATCC 36951]